MGWYENIHTFFLLSDFNFFWPNSFPAALLHKQILKHPAHICAFLCRHLIFTFLLIWYVIFSDSSHTQTRVPLAWLIAYILLLLLMLICSVTYSNTPEEVINCRNICMYLWNLQENGIKVRLWKHHQLGFTYVMNTTVLIQAFSHIYKSIYFHLVCVPYICMTCYKAPYTQTHTHTFPTSLLPLTQPVGSEPSQGI